MGPNFYWKTCRLLFMTLIFILMISKGYGQVKEKLSIDYKIDSVMVGSNFQYSIKVMVSNADSPFTFYLCDKEPWLGGKVIEQHSNINALSYTFLIQNSPNNLVIMVKGSGNDQYNWRTISTKLK